MTVTELIEELRKLPPDIEVVVFDHEADICEPSVGATEYWEKMGKVVISAGRLY